MEKIRSGIIASDKKRSIFNGRYLLFSFFACLAALRGGGWRMRKAAGYGRRLLRSVGGCM